MKIEMPGFYLMRYSGVSDAGAGSVYVGRGAIAGIDVANGRYKGSYSEQDGRLLGKVNLFLPDGGQLVTGHTMLPGASLDATFDWPADFDNGSPQPILIFGRPVHVTFEKISDLP